MLAQKLKKMNSIPHNFKTSHDVSYETNEKNEQLYSLGEC